MRHGGCVRAHTYEYVCVRLYDTCTHILMNSCVRVYGLHVCIRVCTHACVVSVVAHTHTHTHTCPGESDSPLMAPWGPKTLAY